MSFSFRVSLVCRRVSLLLPVWHQRHAKRISTPPPTLLFLLFLLTCFLPSSLHWFPLFPLCSCLPSDVSFPPLAQDWPCPPDPVFLSSLFLPGSLGPLGAVCGAPSLFPTSKNAKLIVPGSLPAQPLLPRATLNLSAELSRFSPLSFSPDPPHILFISWSTPPFLAWIENESGLLPDLALPKRQEQNRQLRERWRSGGSRFVNAETDSYRHPLIVPPPPNISCTRDQPKLVAPSVFKSTFLLSPRSSHLLPLFDPSAGSSPRPDQHSALLSLFPSSQPLAPPENRFGPAV